MKRRIVFLALALLAVWPVVQHQLVRHLDVNPWKLFAWGVYAAPMPPLLVDLVVAEGGRLRAVDRRELPPAVRAELDRFAVRRHALGRLASAAPPARALLAARPEIDDVLVVVRRLEMDPETARFEVREQRELVSRGE